MRIISLLLAGLVSGLVLVAPVEGVSVTNAPSADTTLFENDPGNNLGGATLAAGSLAAQAQAKRARALIRFDLSALPANAVVTNVQVILRVIKAPAGPVPSVFGLHRVAVDWAEGTRSGTRGAVALAGESTWTSRGPGTWAAPGGLAGTDFAAASSGATTIAGVGVYTFASTTLIADVQHWVANPAQNFGWMLISQSEGVAKTARRLGNREGPAAQAPTLVVEYTLGPVGTAPTITTPPADQAVGVGGTAVFGVVASGTEPLSYQWKFNGTDLPGQTASTLTLTDVTVAQAGSYTVVVSNSVGSVTSQPAILAVTKPEVVRFEGITLGSGEVNLRFTVPAGFNYAVQGSGTMAPGSWSTFTNITAKFAPVDAVVPEPAGSGRRFYRIEATPVD